MKGKRILVMLVVAIVFAPATVADERWSDWMFTNDASIEWRWKAYTYGLDIPPNCNFEFRNKLNGPSTFKYVTSYSWRGAGILDQKRGSASEITDAEHGGDSIDKCDRVLTMTVSDVKKTR